MILKLYLLVWHYLCHYYYARLFIYSLRVYKEAFENHVITNVSGGKTVLLKKSNFPDTGIKYLYTCTCIM